MPWTKISIEKTAIDFPDESSLGRSRRFITYGESIREALKQALKRDKNVIVLGEGVDDKSGIFGSTLKLNESFPKRVFDMPIAENGMTGVAIGAAICGMRPVLVHMRMDFLLLSLDQIFNHAAKISYMSGGKAHVPLVIRSIIGRGWGSSAQHSQALHALFMHVPGIKVAMPSSPYDAKGLLLSSIADNNPVVFIEHRWLYDVKGFVPEDEYFIPFGKGVVRRKGKDVSVVAISLMVVKALEAAGKLKEMDIDIEIIDPRTLNPLDEDLIIKSVKKTKRLVILDIGYKTAGLAQIILGRIHNSIRKYLISDVEIVSLPDTHTPSSSKLEEKYYGGMDDIIKAVRKAYGK